VSTPAQVCLEQGCESKSIHLLFSPANRRLRLGLRSIPRWNPQLLFLVAKGNRLPLENVATKFMYFVNFFFLVCRTSAIVPLHRIRRTLNSSGRSKTITSSRLRRPRFPRPATTTVRRLLRTIRRITVPLSTDTVMRQFTATRCRQYRPANRG
jgi:hypothetical protein